MLWIDKDSEFTDDGKAEIHKLRSLSASHVQNFTGPLDPCLGPKVYCTRMTRAQNIDDVRPLVSIFHTVSFTTIDATGTPICQSLHFNCIAGKSVLFRAVAGPG